MQSSRGQNKRGENPSIPAMGISVQKHFSKELPGGGVAHEREAGPECRGLECTCISGSDLLDYIEQGWSVLPLMLCGDLHWICRF